MGNKAKIITVYPVMAGNGAKFVSTNLANSLKEEFADKKVALVDFDLKKPYLAHSLSEFDDIHGLDTLVEKIDGNILSNDLFLENMIHMKNNVELLKGTKLIGKYKGFTTEHITSVIEYLQDLYDYVVISVASEADNAGTVHALNKADEIVVVMRNNLANLKMFDISMTLINHYKKKDTGLKGMYNMFIQNSKTDLGNVVRDYGIEVIGIVEYDETSYDNMNLVNGNGKAFFRAKNKNTEVFAKATKSL